MIDQDDRSSSSMRAQVSLSRRSIVAAGAIIAALGPAAASRAFADNPNDDGPLPGCNPSGNQPKKCVCFLRGTRLKTPVGEVAIETLNIGDAVILHDCNVSRIRWIGRLEFARADGWSEEVLPVRIAKDALGVGIPQRDLYVSRSHLVYLNGVLIPASDIVNGKTITVVTPQLETLQYFHIELDHHAILSAEGAPCESFRNAADSWRTFDNADEYVRLFGHLSRHDMAPFAPIASFNGGRGALKSRLRSALIPILDIRKPQDVARDNIESRALVLEAA